MTPIGQMDAAARKHPQLTARFLKLSREEREEQAERLKKQLMECGRDDQIDELVLVLEHVELETLSHYMR